MEFFIVNAFTQETFGGNPAAVCILQENKSDEWMQNVAKQMNLPITAFVSKIEDEYYLRWFTPTIEIPICGHGTLATSHILWERRHIEKKQPIHFNTKSGKLKSEMENGWIQLQFPSAPDKEIIAPNNLVEALGRKPKYIGKNAMDYIVEVRSEDVVRNIKPNINQISQLPVRGVIITSVSDSEELDFVSRFFSPAQGIIEDYVTGSAHCCLGPYWQRKLNKNEFMAYQASERGGLLKIRLSGKYVFLSGKALTILEGNLAI